MGGLVGKGGRGGWNALLLDWVGGWMNGFLPLRSATFLYLGLLERRGIKPNLYRME